MQFRTEAQPLAGEQGLVTHSTPVLLVGSCFSDNIGDRLVADLFDAAVNPFGPLYNPRSICDAFSMLTEETKIESDQLFEHLGLWRHWSFHSRYSRRDSSETIVAMNTSIADACHALRMASAIFITLGTTDYYILNETGKTVANCHKIPAPQFTKRQLTLHETTALLNLTIRKIRTVNSDAKVVFTVSPLRYLGDGLHANSIIKATLLLAIETVVSANPGTLYFPAYEIMNDDLRDYRFYAEDMKHPSPVAVSYIYDLFGQSFFTESTGALASEARRLTRRLSHRQTGTDTPHEIKEMSLLTLHPELNNGYKRFIKQ